MTPTEHLRKALADHGCKVPMEGSEIWGYCVDAIAAALEENRTSYLRCVSGPIDDAVAEATAPLRKELEAAGADILRLRAVLKALRPEREPTDSEECQECGLSYTLRDNASPSAECDACAHDLLERVRLAARGALQGA